MKIYKLFKKFRLIDLFGYLQVFMDPLFLWVFTWPISWILIDRIQRRGTQSAAYANGSVGEAPNEARGSVSKLQIGATSDSRPLRTKTQELRTADIARASMKVWSQDTETSVASWKETMCKDKCGSSEYRKSSRYFGPSSLWARSARFPRSLQIEGWPVGLGMREATGWSWMLVSWHKSGSICTEWGRYMVLELSLTL
jgi:hypothetical protein